MLLPWDAAAAALVQLEGKAGFQRQKQASYVSPPCSATGYLHATCCRKVIEGVQPELRAELDGVLEQIDVRLGMAGPTVAIRLEEIQVPGIERGQVGAVLLDGAAPGAAGGGVK